MCDSQSLWNCQFLSEQCDWQIKSVFHKQQENKITRDIFYSFKAYSIRHFLPLQALKSLLMCVMEDWATAETKSERETMLNIAKINRKITISCTLVCETVGLSFVLLRLLTIPYRDDSVIYRGYFFYNTTVSPNFELTQIGQIIAIIYVATTYAAVDNFIVLLVLHACGQLLNLKDNLRNLHLVASEDMQARLEKIVEKHNYIAWFVSNQLVNGILSILFR